MDYPKEVQEKLAHLRSYVPFVQRMISKLEMRSQQVGASHGQLERLHGLHGFLTNPIPRAPRMEMLEKMEAVIRSMQDKVHRAQGKPPVSSLNMEPVRLSGSNSPGVVNPRFSQDISHSRTGSSSSDPRTSGKQAISSSREFISGSGGMDSGKARVGQIPSPARTHQHSPASRSGSADWHCKKDFGGRDKRREGQNDRPRERGPESSREGSYDRNRRDSDRSDGRHTERSMDRVSDRSREREYERRSKEYDRRRDSDPHRSWERERSSDRDARLRVPNEKEYERRRESSKDKEYESDKNRDYVRRSTSQERKEYGKDRDFRRGIQDSTIGDRRQVEGRSIGEQEKKQSDGKTSKWSSLLDLPMPPPTLSQDAPISGNESRSASAANAEKFQNSREKLQRLFGIYGESSGTKEKEGSAPKAKGWREEVRARKDQFFSQRSTPNSGDIDERVESHPQRYKMQQQKEPMYGTSHENAPKNFPHHQGNDPRENLEQCKSGNLNRSTSYNPEQPNDKKRSTSYNTEQQNDNFGPLRDTPLSPDQSPVNQFDSTDTPMSPDTEGTFSPTISSEDTTPIKTIPLENIQQKGVDLEAIKKALARIQESERKSESGNSSNQGPSYRYEDFVGPASKSKPDEEEPYDPEEVWNNQELEAPLSNKSASATKITHGDTDLRSMPKTVTSLPQSYQGRMLDKKADIPGSTLYSKGEIQTHNSGPSRSGAPVSISPQRQGSFESQRTNNQSNVSDHTGTPGSSWYQSGSGSRPGNSSDIDMRLHQSKPPLPRHKPITPKAQEPSARSLQSPSHQPSSLQSPPHPSSSLPQRSSLHRPPENSCDRDTNNYPGNRLESVRTRIAHKSGEFIKPGQQGVAASQMEKYKLKKQLASVTESKPPSAISTATKSDVGHKSKESVTVLDLLLPEPIETKVEESSPSIRDPRQINQIPRDPRLKPPDPSETDTLTGAAHARDPRLSSGGGLSRDPRHQPVRDPRQDISKFSSSLHRDDLSRSYGASSSKTRDPRQELGAVSHGAAQVRDPRQDLLSVRGSRDVRQEAAQFPLMTANQHRDPRDPRVLPRGDRVTPVWPQHQPPHVPTPTYPVQAPVTTDPSPSQSASGSLIGQTFTCLMMRGLPPFTNSNHIYHFFQEYILRDISIELDSHFQCKGTAYIHFPSHSSAREALELMNGRSLQGSPIALRICTVGILRQAKNAYENLNREREARLGIPERPRGNGNPFFKPRPKEPPNKPVSKPIPGLSGKPSDKPEPSSNKPQGPVEGSETGGTGQYSELCGVKVPPKSTSAISSFKIPKIKKDEPRHKDNAKGDDVSTVEIQEDKTARTKPSKESSESDVQSVKAKNTKTRKFKKIVIASDSESGDDEPKRSGSKGKKRPDQVTTSQKESTERSKNVGDRDDTSIFGDAKSESVGDRDVFAGSDGESEDNNNDDDDDDNDDDDEGYMVIDETIVLSETEESEVSSQMSEEPLDHTSTSKEHKKKSKVNKTKSKNRGKQKPVKKSTSLKGRKKLQNSSSTGKKVRGKKSTDKYMLDNSYKPELQLNSSVGLKLTRHTQGELEELIPEQKKLKVLIPVPHKIVTTICEDEKIKKKGGRQKVVDTVVQPNDNLKAPAVDIPKEAVQVLPVKERVEASSNKKPDGDNIILPVDGYWEYTAKYGAIGERFLPVNTKLVVALRKEVAVGTPTARRGKKRQVPSEALRNPSKKQRLSILGSPRNEQSVLSDVDSSEVLEPSSTDSKELCKGAEKRSPSVPLKGSDSKRLCLEKEKHTGKSEGTSHFDLFETSLLSDDPDLTQLTPSLLDVDPTISIAIPNASALANVLSPPHISHSAPENVHHKVGADCLWTADKHPSEDEGKLFDVTKPLQSADVRDLGDPVMEEDSVLEEMINIAIKTANTEESREAIENKNQLQEELKGSNIGTEGIENREENINQQSEVKVEDVKDSKAVNEYKTLLEGNTEKEQCKDAISVVKEESCKAPERSDTPVEASSNNEILHVKVEKDSPDEMNTSISDNKTSTPEKVSDSRASADDTLTIDSEEAVTSETLASKTEISEVAVASETPSSKTEISDTEAATKLSKSCGIGIVTQEDTDDDVASVGKVSTSSFVDDASIVSSEGRDVRTPECQPPKRGRKGKNQISLPSVECRRVTRGSVLEPLTAEHVEWDDGGIVDLFQCDQCDYVGRHIANHLANFHTDREMPCEFKKEDFPPVIKDYVGPPQEGTKEAVPLDLSWIPNSMNFDDNVTCRECDYCSKNRFDLIYHYLEHFPKAASSVYHCRLCNYMCEKKESFYNHVSSHTGEYRFRCELCGHWTYKKELLQAHHKDNHKSQPESFFEGPMTEDNGWLYIYVCKVCMFVRINIAGAERHVQQKHGGRADIHKANMSRPIVLHSELRKPGSESESTLQRPKYKGKKKKKGKKLPDLEVFLGEEEDDEEEIEEKAKQLVDRISSNIHTTMSVEDAKKRMSLLNSISKKLDEETEEDNMEQEPESKSKHEEEPSLEPQKEGSSQEPQKEKPSEPKKEEPSIESEPKHKQRQPSTDTAPPHKLEVGHESSTVIGEICEFDKSKEKGNAEKEPHNTDKEKGVIGALRRESENLSTESDSESTMSAIEPDAFEDEVVISGSGSLQDTIRKLSAKLEECVKEKKVIQQKDEEPQNTVENKEQKTVVQGAASNSAHDNDSDSDTLVICEDSDSDKDEEREKLSDLSQTDQCSRDSTSDGETGLKSSLQDSIQSILREASTQGQTLLPMPKLRIRPAHQLIETPVSAKGPKQKQQERRSKKVTVATVFKCCVSGCYYNSFYKTDLIQHIIQNHGPYKCIASGCRFVTKSKDLYHIHLLKLHPKLNFLVCPFHCKNVFVHFVELIDHLTTHHSQQFTDQEQPEEDSESPGFLKIESVSTLDPAAASQMFGDDFATTPREARSASLLVQSPTKTPERSPQGTPLTSPQRKILNCPQATTVTTQGITKSPDTPYGNNIFTTVVSPTSSERIVSVTSPTSSRSIAPANPSVMNLTPLSTPPRATTTATVADSPASTVSSKNSEDTGSSILSTPEKANQPTCVTIDEEESHEQKEHSPPPGMATLPKSPPTVPVQFIFQVYQTADVFKTLITKLAPEVFKCMYSGCVFAEDDAEVFINHITEHGRDYRCCYCLVLMATPEHLVQHVITEHSHCQFQCKYCLYRAFTKIYMGVHLKNFHPHDEPRYIKVETIQPHPPPNPPIDQFVRPYRCTYQDCQYRTVDAEAFKTHVNSHGRFVILSCDFCHKHLHVIPLIDHMREHQMNEYQCPYCLHGDAEKERLLSHLLNCHSGRPGKVLLRKQITSSVNSTAPCIETPQPPPLPPSSSTVNESDSNLDVMNSPKDSVSSDKHEEEAKSVSQANMKNLPKIGPVPGKRRLSRTSSTELDNFKGFEESSLHPDTASDDSFLQATEKTGLSGHALYRCGNDGCEYSSLSQIKLREHLQICDLAQDSTILRCYHCGKQCRHLSTLLDHLRVHGPKRFYCGVTGCDYRATMVHYFKNHMKQIHKCAGFKQLLKDSRNKDLESQEYVVYPKDAVPTREGHRRRKNEYGIEDIHRIPRAHVSYQELKCYHCPFVSKVRLNLIKHIRLHEKYPDGIPQRLNVVCGSNCAIPFKQPVNPVPCLERKELMFDKMMNLAGSSFETKKKNEDGDLRAKNPIPPEEYQRLPKYVPEERLYTCGIEGCNYLSCDDMMLKYHIRTLHADATTFPCPHCIDMSITVEKMSSHFKLHGERLYRCGWCQYISSRRNVVDRHMKEKHHSKKLFDYVIREPEDPDAQKKSEEKPVEEPVVSAPQPTQPTPQWQCGLCKFSSMTGQEMLNHTSIKHSIKSQFKCGYCSVRSSVRASFDAHFASKHPTQPFRVLCMYYRLDSEDIEPLNHGDAQHMHEPLWKRNDPERIRHIRGILIDDDPEIKKNWFRQTSKGKPDKGEFVCPRCGSFKTACVSTFRSHLCREASYARYQCAECGISNALLPSLQRHYTKMHHAPFTSESYLELPIEEEKEAWVESVVSHQGELIKRWHERSGSEASAESSLPQEKSVISSRRSSASASSNSLSGDTTQEQGGIVLHDSGSERGRYICDTCGSECRSAAGLKSHITAMHQARFKCHYCPFASNSEDAVKQHSSTRHPKLQSEVLDVSQRSKIQRGDSSASEDFTSPDKNKEDPEQEGIASPVLESSLVAPLDHSGVNSEDNSDLAFERDIIDTFGDNVEDSQPSTTKVYSCPFCLFTTTTTSRLNHHKRSKHSETRLYMCMYCKGRFNTTMDALRHHKWKHMPQPPKISHIMFCKKEDNVVNEQDDVGSSESSEVQLSSRSNTTPKVMSDPKPGRSKARKSFPKSSLRQFRIGSSSGPSSNLSVESTFTCCHCSHQSNKIGIEEHMKKQHRDLPYQVRREEKDRIFTEVHIYKCIHCVVESISLAQAMDHWIQNHPLLDFKFDLVLRHSGEVSNQVVSSTTVDKDLAHETMDTGSSVSLSDVNVSIVGTDGSTISSSAIPSCSDITSSSESSDPKLTQVSRRRESQKDASSSRCSVDAEEDEIVDVCEIVGNRESEIQSSTDAESEDAVYKCGLCKKSSDKLYELQAHIKKIHPERDVKIKKFSREVFEQLFRAEYKCDYCNERGRHKPITRHHKSSHPGLPLKVSRLSQPPRENVYFR